MEDIDAIKKMGDSSDEDLDGKYFLKNKNFKKWYFVTKIVLTYCEKKLF